MAETAALPSWDEAMQSDGGEGGEPLPTWEDAMKQNAPSAYETTAGAAKAVAQRGVDYLGGGGWHDTPENNAAIDEFFKNTSAGRIVGRFGFEATSSINNMASTEPLGIVPGSEADKALIKATENIESSHARAFTDGLVRSAATSLDVAGRMGVSLLNAPMPILQGSGGAIAQIGEEFGLEHASSEDISQAINAVTIDAIHVGVPHGEPDIHTELARAQANHVIGPGVDEAVYFGTKELTPEQEDIAHSAAQEIPQPIETEAVPESPAKVTDIHEAARNIDPVTFSQYDELQKQRDTMRGWIDDLAEKQKQDAEDNAPHAEEIKKLDDQISTIKEAKKGGYGKIKSLEEKRDALTEANESAINDALADESPDIKLVRQKLQEIDYKMRDLSPKVSEAYRTADEFMPKQSEPEGVRPEDAAAQQVAEEPQPQKLQEAQSPEKAPTPIEVQRQNIINDVSRQMMEAGRPKEESDAAAALVAAHYDARAQRFGGKIGTAEEMYGRDSANIRAGRDVKTRARELAQDDKNDPRELEQKTRGKIRLATEDAKATITLMKSANASTFIHETAHHWLDELVRDAGHGDAPDDLVKDSEAIRKWLGEEGGPYSGFTAKQHEKFARGFERCLMEGIAPSKELEGIFAKFKQWLTSIYHTVEALKSPITDDIRDVFDRLLSANPEKIVIASEREPGKEFADIHEVDAANTPPEKALPVAENIRGERHEIIDKKAPEDKNEITRGQSSKDAAGAAGSAEPDGNANAPQPDTGQGGAVSESGAVGAGGDQAAAEGGGISEPATAAIQGSDGSGDVAAGTDPRSGGDAAASRSGTAKPEPDPTGTSTPLGRPESDLIDKAGNIRLENLTDNESVREVMRLAARDSNDFADARRGVVTDQQVSKLAEAMGVGARELNLKKLRAMSLEDGIPLAVRIKVGRQMLVQSSEHVRDLMTKAATGTDQDLMDLAEARARHLMIAETVSAVTEEWGRAGRAFRDISKEEMQSADKVTELFQKMTGMAPDQIRKMAKMGAALDTPQKIAKFLQDSQRPHFSDQILEYWQNGLISGPRTHTTYVVGNELLALWKQAPETAVASAINKIHELLGHETSGITLGEIGVGIKARYEALPSALHAAGQAIKTGLTTLLPGEDAAQTAFQSGTKFANMSHLSGRVVEGKTWGDVGADLYGVTRGLKDAFLGIGEMVKSGIVSDEPLFEKKRSPLGLIPDVSIKGVTVPTGAAARLPGRFVAAFHSFSRTLNYSMEKASLAYRDAMAEGGDGEKFASRMSDIMTNPSQKLMERARTTATDLTLMGAGGEFTRNVVKLTNSRLFGIRLLKFIDPFVPIASSIIDHAVLKRSPVGLLSSELRADLAGVNGAEARDFAQARMLTGTAFSMLIGGLTAQGMISPSAPSDPKEAAAWRILGGNQPHSVKINGTWYDVNRLGPLGMQIGIAADLYHAMHHVSDEDATKVAHELVHAVTQNILDESFMRGPAELMKALDNGDRYGADYVKNFLSSFTPYSVGMSQIARAIDPYTRQARTTMDAIKAKIPFLSETLLPRRDIWGEPIANKEALGIDGFSAIYESKATKDPTNIALLKLGVFPPQPEREIRGVELTDKQYDDYTRIAGRTLKMRLDAIINTPGFSSAPEYYQREIIQKNKDQTREQARRLIMMESPDIVQKATQRKMAKVSSR